MTALRKTRRGWSLLFLAAPTDGTSGGNGGPGNSPGQAPAAADPAAPAAPADLRATLIAALKLDANASDEQISAALEDLVNKPASELGPNVRKALKLDDTASDTDVTSALIATVEKLEGFESSAQQARETEINAQLDELEIGDDAKAILREQMLADPEKAKTLVAAFPKKAPAAPAPAAPAAPAEAAPAPAAPAAPAKKTPPAPTHDPAAANATLSAEERANKISERAKAIVKESKNKISLSKAYQQAERELDAA